MSEIILSTTDFIPNKEIDEIMGIARDSTVRARNIGRDIFADLKNIVGGEIKMSIFPYSCCFSSYIISHYSQNTNKTRRDL